jgi:hypothetical protein
MPRALTVNSPSATTSGRTTLDMPPPVSRRSRWSSRLAIVSVLAGLALLATGCGSASSTSSAGASATTGGDQQAARQAYRDCMASNGVTLPDRGRGGGQGQGTFNPSGSGGQTDQGQGGGPGQGTVPGVDPATMQKARDACQSLRPAGGSGGGLGGTAFQAYASCMKDHGVTLPTRGDDSTNTSTPPSSIDRSSATFQAANNACRALMPSGGPGGPGGDQGGSSTTTTTSSAA